MEIPDRQLLERFVTERDEDAFRALVQRHVAVVHGVARRITASEDLAGDVAQQAFVRLAQRAATLPPEISLTAWLHRVTRHLAIDLVRREERRKARERSGGENLRAEGSAAMHPMMTTTHEDGALSEAGWAALAPVLDELVDALPAADREVVLARYYRAEPHAEIARRLGVSEALARKRASRALEKLRALLGKKGVATTAAALSVLLPAHAAPPAPAGVLRAISTAVRGVAPVAPAGIQAFLFAMNATQKTWLAAAAALFLGALGYAVRPAAATAQAVVSGEAPASSQASGDQGRAARRERPVGAYPDTPDARRQRLQEIMLQRDPLQRQREMIAFLDRTPPGLFPEIAEHLAAIDSGGMLGGESRMLLGAWAAVDPAAAADASLKMKQSGQFTEAVYTWGAKDPAAALAWCGENAPDWWSSVLAGMGTVDLPGAIRRMKERPGGGDPGDMYWLFTQMSVKQPDALGRLLAALPEGEERDDLLVRAGDYVALSSPEVVLDLLRQYPDVASRLKTGPMYQTLAIANPDAAMERMARMPEQERRGPAAVTFAAMGARDLSAALALLEKHPELATDDTARAQMLGAARPQDLDLALSLLPGIRDVAARDSAWTTLLQHWRGSPGKEAAEEWISAHATELPDAVRTTVTQPLPPPPEGRSSMRK